MKKILAVCLCAGISVAFCGCSLGNMLEEFTSTGDLSAEAPVTPGPSHEPKERVYMDEITGKLDDFTGSTLRLSAEKSSYTFDVSEASLECKAGMIAGDEISVIYEGQLENTDTSMVKALKVVDVYHNKEKLKTQMIHGIVQGLTPNTITVKADDGVTATYPITGTPQYYQGGIQKGSSVFIKFRGRCPEAQDNTILNASHLKVLSISDLEEFSPGKELPNSSSDSMASDTLKEFRAKIYSVDGNILQVIPSGQTTVQNLDMSATTACFSGGMAPGSNVIVTYTGELKEDSLENITVHSITGDDPKTINKKRISFTATGSVVGTTANTVTIKTLDGAFDIFRKNNASDISTGGLSEGCMIQITFNPAQSGSSNIYEALQISDA